MDIKESKNFISKKINKKYLELLFKILDDSKKWVLFSAVLSIFRNNEDYKEFIGYFCTLSTLYILLFTIANLVTSSEINDELTLYKMLKNELNLNKNRFENMNEEEVDEEIKRLLRVKIIRY